MSDTQENFVAAADTATKRNGIITSIMNNKIYTAGGIALAATAAFVPVGAIALSLYFGIKTIPGALRKWHTKDGQSSMTMALASVFIPTMMIASHYIWDQNKTTALNDAKQEITDKILAGKNSADATFSYDSNKPFTWVSTPKTIHMHGEKTNIVENREGLYFTISFSDKTDNKYHLAYPTPSVPKGYEGQAFITELNKK